MCQKPPLSIRRYDRHTILLWFASLVGWLFGGTNNLTMLKNQAILYTMLLLLHSIDEEKKKKTESFKGFVAFYAISGTYTFTNKAYIKKSNIF